jgi:EAL domain-containing protein (putative c-di-GMP-specific phosphodiesterase class I)/GGDEF domain-containing protein
MTLFKQMAMMLTLFLGVILISVMVLNFRTATAFVQDQLYTNAKNTAHSLGLSLSKIVDPEDIASMETMINAIYDSGYYERIALLDVEQKPIYVKSVDVRISDVPQWFVGFVSIHNAYASSDIMMGWSRFGTLEVSGHTGNAYRQLYHTFIDLVQTFMVIGIIVLGLLYLLLTLSLQSVKQIREQARGIIENRFIIEPKMPFTTEFRSATVAMNAMVSKVKDIFERENDTLVRYQELLYKDGETKVFNRRYFVTKLPDYLRSDAVFSQGAYILLSIDELDRFKKEQGYESYSLFIKQVLKGLNGCTGLSENTLHVRLNENDFFLLIPMVDTNAVKQLIDTMLVDLHKMLSKDVLSYLFIGVGVGIYNSKDNQQSLLSRADFTVAQAKQNETFSCVVEKQYQDSLVLSREAWRTELLSGLEESRFLLASQNVMHLGAEVSTILHQEMYVRLHGSDGEIHSAGVFIPMAATLGLVDEIDKYMVKKILERSVGEGISNPVAINLGAEFVKKHSNIEWLKTQLERCTGAKRVMLWFEVSNVIALHNLEAMITLSSTLKMFGYRFGIDNFTIPEQGAYYLQAIRPDYVKCSVRYLSDVMLDANTGSNQESLNNLTRSLGISIIATNVEDEKELAVLHKIGISYAQGRYIAPITLLEEGGK